MHESPSENDIELIDVTDRLTLARYSDFMDLNSVAIALNNFIVIIDGLYYPRQSREFRSYVESKFHLPVKYVFVTHFHADHIFGLATYKDAEMFGSSRLAESIQKRAEASWTDSDFDRWREEEPERVDDINEIEILYPDWSFEENHEIVDGDLKFEFYHSGGHTQCSSYAYFPAEKILFAGDEIHSNDWPHISEPCGSPEKMIAAYEHMLSLRPEIVIPGHGDITDSVEIQKNLEFVHEFIERVKKAIADGTKPENLELPDSITTKYDWKPEYALRTLFGFYSHR